MLLAFFVISIFIVTMDVEPPAPTANVLAVAVDVSLRRVRFRKSIFREGYKYVRRRLNLRRRRLRICRGLRKRSDARRQYFHHAR